MSTVTKSSLGTSASETSPRPKSAIRSPARAGAGAAAVAVAPPRLPVSRETQREEFLHKLQQLYDMPLLSDTAVTAAAAIAGPPAPVRPWRPSTVSSLRLKYDATVAGGNLSAWHRELSPARLAALLVSCFDAALKRPAPGTGSEHGSEAVDFCSSVFNFFAFDHGALAGARGTHLLLNILRCTLEPNNGLSYLFSHAVGLAGAADTYLPDFAGALLDVFRALVRSVGDRSATLSQALFAVPPTATGMPADAGAAVYVARRISPASAVAVVADVLSRSPAYALSSTQPYLELYSCPLQGWSAEGRRDIIAALLACVTGVQITSAPVSVSSNSSSSGGGSGSGSGSGATPTLVKSLVAQHRAAIDSAFTSMATPSVDVEVLAVGLMQAWLIEHARHVRAIEGGLRTAADGVRARVQHALRTGVLDAIMPALDAVHRAAASAGTAAGTAAGPQGATPSARAALAADESARAHRQAFRAALADIISRAGSLVADPVLRGDVVSEELQSVCDDTVDASARAAFTAAAKEAQAAARVAAAHAAQTAAEADRDAAQAATIAALAQRDAATAQVKVLSESLSKATTQLTALRATDATYAEDMAAIKVQLQEATKKAAAAEQKVRELQAAAAERDVATAAPGAAAAPAAAKSGCCTIM